MTPCDRSQCFMCQYEASAEGFEDSPPRKQRPHDNTKSVALQAVNVAILVAFIAFCVTLSRG